MWPIGINKIKRLQIELTTFCNADCPSCERAKYSTGPIYKRYLNSIHLSFESLQKWLPLSDMKSLKVVHFCGNIDEPTLHPEIFEICEWLDKYDVHISTNGGTRNVEFWEKMAGLRNTSVIFGIDGLEDTNHIYRKNVRWKKLHQNYTTYIKKGGKAMWQFIIFDHNKHQLDEARERSIDEGFVSFNTVYSSRENFEVEAVEKKREKETCIKCKATYDNDDLGYTSLYIDVRGNVWPCCWMATSDTANYDVAPKTNFGHFLAHNLNYDTFQDIIEGDMFSYLWDNLHQFEVCNLHCKENITDTITWKGSYVDRKNT